MRVFGFVLSLISALLVLSSVVEAWSWTDEVSGLIYGHGEVVNKRADDASSETTETAKETASATATATADTASATATGTITDAASTGTAASGTKAQATTGSNTKSSSGTKKTSTSTSIDARLPEGGISMITPAATASSSYYKIGNWVTFAWNYTSLSVTPSAIDILASCSANDHYYTIALNQTVEPTNKILWDTGEYQSSATIPLLTETYTLVIYDAAKEVSATAGAGYLGTYDTYTFGMYVPQQYTPLNEFTCATCSGALSLAERQAFGFLLTMSALTVLSFTFFAGGFGVFR